MQSSGLIHLIYASASAFVPSPDQLDGILAVSRRNNGIAGITGMLLYVEGSFFQILEGTTEAVDATYARISLDRRHTSSTLIIREAIARPSFSESSMGFTRLSNDNVASIAGHNDFFTGQNCLATLDPGRARKLLQAFSTGRWRVQLQKSQSRQTTVV